MFGVQCVSFDCQDGCSATNMLTERTVLSLNFLIQLAVQQLTEKALINVAQAKE